MQDYEIVFIARNKANFYGWFFIGFGKNICASNTNGRAAYNIPIIVILYRAFRSAYSGCSCEYIGKPTVLLAVAALYK